MQVEYNHCGELQRVALVTRHRLSGRLVCPQCGAIVTKLDVTGCSHWIEQQVERKRRMVQAGRLGTRKQALRRTDEEIDREGLAAELALCVMLCPGSFQKWKRATEQGGNNRGNDLRMTWTGFDKPVEVKQTKYHDERRGFLLVRPPRFTPGAFRVEDIDDAYYLLLHGEPRALEVCGWIDRERLVKEGQRNPVPVASGQRECWGIHWSRLSPLQDLVVRCEASVSSSKMDPLPQRIWAYLRSLLQRS